MGDVGLGMFLAFLAPIGFGSSSVFARVALQHMSPMLATLISLVAGFALVAVVALAVEFHDFWTLSSVAFGWFLLLGFVNFPMGRYLTFSAVHLAGVARVAPLLAAAPLFALAWAVSLGGERPGALTVLGSLSIVLGVALILSERRAQG